MLNFFSKKQTFQKKRLETYLNGKNNQNIVFTFHQVQNERFCRLRFHRRTRRNDVYCCDHNSVPNRTVPRKQPGLYMIRCLQNDWRYYGESSNVSGRLASHKSLLNRGIHPNRVLQNDWDTFNEQNFDFVVLFMGEKWELPYVRRGKEVQLIVLNRDLTYNILEGLSRPGDQNPFWKKVHTPETKKKISDALKNRPNHLLGHKVSIKGKTYPSIAEASRQTGMARKTIRQKSNDPENVEYFFEKEPLNLNSDLN